MQEPIVQLRTPLTPEYAATVRLFLAESGRHFHAEVEPIADLMIAATEAFALAAKALHDTSDPATFSIEVNSSGEAMQVLISATNGFNYDHDRESDSFDISGAAIIEGLFPGLNPSGSQTLRLSIPTS